MTVTGSSNARMRPSRRTWLRRTLGSGCAAVASAFPVLAQGHDALGPVTPPRSAPNLPLLLHDGRRTNLPDLLRGHVTAIHLMFTGCSAICPLQGAVFAELQSMVANLKLHAQLLSISIDPLADDPAALTAWRKRFGAGAAWLAAAPPIPNADTMPTFLTQGGVSKTANDRHNLQVHLFDTQGRWAFRSAELASPQSIALAVQQLAARK